MNSFAVRPFTYSLACTATPAPGLVENPGAGVAEQAKEFVKGLTAKEFIVDNLLPIGGGLLGTKLLMAKVLYPLYVGKSDSAKAKADPSARLKRLENFGKYKAWIEMGTGVLAGLGIGFGLKNTPMALRVAAGGIIAGAVTFIEGNDSWKKAVSMEGLGGMGQTVASEVRRRLSAAVREDVKAAEAGVGAFLTEEQAMSGGGVGAYLTEEAAEGTQEFAQAAPVGDMQSGISVDDFMSGPSMGW